MKAMEYQPNQDHNYTRLSFDGLNLLLFHNDIHSIEPAGALNVDTRSSHSVGRMTTRQGCLDAYCLNSQLELMEEMALSRKYGVILPAGADTIAIMCEQADVVRSRVPRMTSIPECMQIENSPVRYMSVHKAGVDLVMHANDLVDHIQWLASNNYDSLLMHKQAG